MTLAGRLPTTRWSLVVRAAEVSDDPCMRQTAKQSLEELCEIYWPALYAYLRRRGRSRQDAEDLIQGFFADLLERESIAAADASRGRFRAFLYASLDHYVANEVRSERAIRRGGHATVLSIDRQRMDDYDREYDASQIPDAEGDPAVVFDRQWANCLLRQTLQELREEYDDKGKGEWFEKLAPMLTAAEVAPQTRQETARQLGLTMTALKVAVHRLRATYRRRLLEAVAQTVDDPNECGRERQWLFEALGKHA